MAAIYREEAIESIARNDTIEHGTAFYGPYGNAVPTLHPDQDRFYFSSRNVSPGDVYVARLGSPGTAPQFSDSPYHGEYEVCGRVALKSRLALPPVTVGQDRHAQFGRMAFTRGNGQRLLLSHLRGAEAAASMRLSTLP